MTRASDPSSSPPPAPRSAEVAEAIRQVEGLIAANALPEAIQGITDLAKQLEARSRSFMDDAIAINSEHRHHMQMERQGKYTSEQVTTTRNKLISRMLGFLNMAREALNAPVSPVVEAPPVAIAGKRTPDMRELLPWLAVAVLVAVLVVAVLVVAAIGFGAWRWRSGPGPTWMQYAELARQAKRPLEIRLNRPTYRVGDTLEVRLSTEEGGFLMVIAVDEKDVPTRLFPNHFHPDSKVGSGELTIPGGMGFDLQSSSPGDTLIVVFLTPQPVDLEGTPETAMSPFRSLPTVSDRGFKVVAKKLEPAVCAGSVVAAGAR